MLAGIVLTALSALMVALGWWAFVHPLRERGERPAAERRPQLSRAYGGDPVVSENEVRVPRELTAEWADRTQIWAALVAENALLADRLAGRIDREVYRGGMLALALRYEPASDDRR
ncbi:hypothetical protein [Nocardia crassostreae]|uniref:hypothetical protein n=1 Tax=Nocardia crassostreae TaxID=53428 RepID=UPI00082BE7D9|nr:hypothetical protein [Nocardia crassostreae]